MGVRPSDHYHINDELTAFCFDRAVILWGTSLESAVRAKTESAKTRASAKRSVQSVMDKWLYCDKPENAPGRFKDPALL